MAKRRIKFKLGEIKISGVELDIEDDREAATAALSNVQNLLAGAVQPVVSKALLGVGGHVLDAPSGNGQQPTNSTPRKRRKLSPSASVNTGEDSDARPISFVHDPDKFGNPQQAWSTPNKAVWLLWVAEQATGKKELTVSEIVSTFNQQYRQFGTISASYVSRDLGYLRKKNPPPVGVDANRSPQVWFLYDAGKALGERLAKGLDTKATT